MPILQVYVDDKTHAILQNAAVNSDRKIEDLAEAAVAETALEWAKANGGLTKTDVDLEHPLKAGIDQSDQPDLHRHPIHDAIETENGGES